MRIVERRPLTDAILEYLRALPGVAVFDAEVNNPPLIPGSSRVAPYLIVWPRWGADSLDQALDPSAEDIVLPVQVTCVGSDRSTVEHLAGRAHRLMRGWQPPVDEGLSAGEFYPPPGYVPQIVPEGDITPRRFSIALQYVAQVGA